MWHGDTRLTTGYVVKQLNLSVEEASKGKRTWKATGMRPCPGKEDRPSRTRKALGALDIQGQGAQLIILRRKILNFPY